MSDAPLPGSAPAGRRTYDEDVARSERKDAADADPMGDREAAIRAGVPSLAAGSTPDEVHQALMSRKAWRKHNSTSTMYLKSTMRVPNNDEISLGVATVVYCQIVQDLPKPLPHPAESRIAAKAYELWKKFCEDTYRVDTEWSMGASRVEKREAAAARKEAGPKGLHDAATKPAALMPDLAPAVSPVMTSEYQTWLRERHPSIPKHITIPMDMPEIRGIYGYIKSVFDLAQFSPECNVIATVLMYRFIAKGGIPLGPKNWRVVMLVALLVAQKVWDDRCLANIDFPVIWKRTMPSNMHQSFDVATVNRLEMIFLETVMYNVRVKASLYAKFYFELRSLSEETFMRSGGKIPTPKPLDKAHAERLEARSGAFSKDLETRYGSAKKCMTVGRIEGISKDAKKEYKSDKRKKGRAVIS